MNLWLTEGRNKNYALNFIKCHQQALKEYYPQKACCKLCGTIACMCQEYTKNVALY